MGSEVVTRYYFDHNATSPPLPGAIEAFVRCSSSLFANPSSVHQDGQAARRSLDSSRRSVARLLNASDRDVIFTASGTEANNIAILGSARSRGSGHLVCSAVEHPAVLRPCESLAELGFALTVVPPRPTGLIDPDAIARAMRPDTFLVCVMHVNNEVGTIQPVREIASIARDHRAWMHVDGVQAAGKIPVDVVDLGVDSYALSGHKFGAPRGVGALFIRQGAALPPVWFGGNQERGLKPGTENVAGAAAMGFAAETAIHQLPASRARTADLRDQLEEGILRAVPEARVNGGGEPRAPNVTNIRFAGFDGEAMVIALDLRGIAVSSGAACSSGAVEPSHVLTAMGLSKADARSSVRFSLGPGNDETQIEAVIAAVTDSASHLRRLLPKEAAVA
jgi:cysteine desulfurase